MDLGEIGFADRNTLLTALDPQEWVCCGQIVRLDDTELTAKDEVHITVVNKDLGGELARRVVERPKVKAQIARAIEDAAWNQGGCAYTRGRLYHVAKDKDRVDDQGRPVVLHAESIIQRVEVPGIDGFYAALSAIVGRPLEIPPTHVTLYTLGDPRGIGIQDWCAFETYVTREISPDELVPVDPVEDADRYCVYILSCADGSFYTGMTLDLARRLAEHRAGRGARWTRRRLPVELVFSLDGLEYRSAREVERYVKSLGRERKRALVEREPGMLALVHKRI